MPEESRLRLCISGWPHGFAIPAGELVPSDATHLPYNDGASVVAVSLSPGRHKLTAQLADGAHNSYGPAMSQTITVTVR